MCAKLSDPEDKISKLFCLFHSELLTFNSISSFATLQITILLGILYIYVSYIQVCSILVEN